MPKPRSIWDIRMYGEAQHRKLPLIVPDLFVGVLLIRECIMRTTAQGIYNQCKKISPSEARAGDLIFFENTYSSYEPVTHIGIYAGNNRMLHCGNPIQYTSTQSAYWKSHFYGFGRLEK